MRNDNLIIFYRISTSFCIFIYQLCYRKSIPREIVYLVIMLHISCLLRYQLPNLFVLSVSEREKRESTCTWHFHLTFVSVILFVGNSVCFSQVINFPTYCTFSYTIFISYREIVTDCKVHTFFYRSAPIDTPCTRRAVHCFACTESFRLSIYPVSLI